MKSIGVTIKEIRKMKKMKQKDFSKLSQGAISNIESSERNITLDKLLDILKDFKMSLREFEYIRNDYQLNESDRIFFDFVNMKNSIEIANDPELLNHLKKHVDKNPTDFIPYCILIIEDVYTKISITNTYNVDSPEAFEIWSKLYGLKKWTYKELYVMSKLFFVFPSELGTKVIERIEKEMGNYIEFFKDIHFDATFYMNVGKYYVHKNKLNLAKHYLQKTIPLCDKYNKVTVENDAYAHLAIINYLQGDTDAENDVLNCIERYHHMRKPNLAKDLESDWNTFFKNNINERKTDEYQKRP